MNEAPAVQSFADLIPGAILGIAFLIALGKDFFTGSDHS